MSVARTAGPSAEPPHTGMTLCDFSVWGCVFVMMTQSRFKIISMSPSMSLLSLLQEHYFCLNRFKYCACFFALSFVSQEVCGLSNYPHTYSRVAGKCVPYQNTHAAYVRAKYPPINSVYYSTPAPALSQQAWGSYGRTSILISLCMCWISFYLSSNSICNMFDPCLVVLVPHRLNCT